MALPVGAAAEVVTAFAVRSIGGDTIWRRRRARC